MADDSAFSHPSSSSAPPTVAPRPSQPRIDDGHGGRQRGTARLLASAEHPIEPASDQLQRIVRTAVAEIDGARWVTVTVPNGGVMTTVAASDRVAVLIDQAQRDADDGPVLTIPPSAGAVVHSCDLVEDRRWPRFAPPAHQLGVAAALCYRIGIRSGPAGVLGVYADRRNAFSMDSDQVARLLALYAGIALDTEVLQRNLQEAARARDVIGQAKGMLMERLHVRPEQAFATLVARSHAARSPVCDVANHLVSTGQLP